MTPRERVLSALNHQPPDSVRQPDRVPLDFGGHRSSGIAAIAYPKLRRFLGLPERPVRVYDVIQQLAIIDEDVLDRFGVDTIELGRGFAGDDASWHDWVLPDGTPCQVPSWVSPEREPGGWVIRSDTSGVIRSDKGRVIAQQPLGFTARGVHLCLARVSRPVRETPRGCYGRKTGVWRGLATGGEGARCLTSESPGVLGRYLAHKTNTAH